MQAFRSEADYIGFLRARLLPGSRLVSVSGDGKGTSCAFIQCIGNGQLEVEMLYKNKATSWVEWVEWRDVELKVRPARRRRRVCLLCRQTRAHHTLSTTSLSTYSTVLATDAL